MQDHARRIRLRHMMNQVIVDSTAPLALDGMTDKLMEMFRKDQNLIDTLLPELTGEEAPATFGHNKWVPVHRALRYMVLREFTTGVRRTDCLESMGLARVDYDGLVPANKKLREWAETVGISPDEAVAGISLISTTGGAAGFCTSLATRSSPASTPRTTRTFRRVCCHLRNSARKVCS
jgi:hypothetical protein